MLNLLHYIVVWQFLPTMHYRSIFNDKQGFTTGDALALLNTWANEAGRLQMRCSLSPSNESEIPHYEFVGYIDGVVHSYLIFLSPGFTPEDWQKNINEQWDILTNQSAEFPAYVKSPPV